MASPFIRGGAHVASLPSLGCTAISCQGFFNRVRSDTMGLANSDLSQNTALLSFDCLIYVSRTKLECPHQPR